MSRMLLCFLIALQIVTPSFGQSADPSSDQPTDQAADQKTSRGRGTGDAIDIPLPIGSPRAYRPGLIVPQTPKEKAARAFRNTFYLRPVASRALLAGWDHLLDDPTEWPGGGKGVAMRFGDRMASRAVRESIRLGADVAFRTDSRYDLCECTSAKGRLVHAWKRVYMTRTDAGGETVSVANLAGAFATPWITRTWLPDSENTTSAKLNSAAMNLLFRGLGNTLREFWPDIARKTHLPARFGGMGGDRYTMRQ